MLPLWWSEGPVNIIKYEKGVASVAKEKLFFIQRFKKNMFFLNIFLKKTVFSVFS